MCFNLPLVNYGRCADFCLSENSIKLFLSLGHIMPEIVLYTPCKKARCVSDCADF